MPSSLERVLHEIEELKNKIKEAEIERKNAKEMFEAAVRAKEDPDIRQDEKNACRFSTQSKKIEREKYACKNNY